MVIKYERTLRSSPKSNTKARPKWKINCIVHFIKSELNKLGFYDYKGYHKDSCSDPLFYLEDLGIIKILSGGNRISGVDCHDLKIKALHPFKYNKIWKEKNFIILFQKQ